MTDSSATPERYSASSVRIVSGDSQPDDENTDVSLRPRRLSEFVGQATVKENLAIGIQAARMRGEPLDHIILYGPPGLGKTTLAHIIANEMGVNIKVTSGPAIERAGDMAAILTALQPDDILFIDEIHRLHRTVEEVLYSAMEDFFLSWMVGKGTGGAEHQPAHQSLYPHWRHHPFLHDQPSRCGTGFGSIFRLDYYEHADMEVVVKRSASHPGRHRGRGRGRFPDRGPIPGHAAHCQPPAQAHPRLRAGGGRRQDNRRGGQGRPWTASGWMAWGWTRPTTAC